MKPVKLKQWKIDTRYTLKAMGEMFDVSPRTVTNWINAGFDYKRENGNHVISRNQVIKTIPIKKGK